MVHANDLAFDLDQHFFEGLCGRPTLFGRQVGQARLLLQLRHKVPNCQGRPRQKKVDTLLGQQDGALELQVVGTRQQRVAQSLGVGQRHELVGGNVQDGAHLAILEVRQASTLKKARKAFVWCKIRNKRGEKNEGHAGHS